MTTHGLWRLRFPALLGVLLFPGLGISRNEKPAVPPDTFVCGTNAKTQKKLLTEAFYHDYRNLRRTLSAPAPPALEVDVGDVAVIEDDGTILSSENQFDLAGTSFRFEPAGPAAYRVVSTSTTFDSSGGAIVPLGDDDSRSVALGFSFTFFEASYSSAFVNSDGNLTFGQQDSESTDRDLVRFSSGPPRIGPFFSDLDPEAGGGVSSRIEADGILFIWNNVPNFGISSSNSFSVKLFQNGNIEFVYGPTVDARPDTSGAIAVAGVSPGVSQGGIVAVDFSNDLPTSVLGGTIVEVFSSRQNISITALARRFFEAHRDEFDDLIVFLAFDFTLEGNAFAFEVGVKNEIEGIGLAPRDLTAAFGSNGRLKSFVMMGSLDGPARYPSDPNQLFLRTNSTMGIMGQEVGHRWLAFVAFRDGDINSRAILGRDNAHWSFFFDSDASVLEGNDIQDQGNGQFTTVAATTTYSRLDRYVMGLAGKEEVPGMFLVENPTGGRNRSSPPTVGINFTGTRKNISIDDVIAANGPRRPTVFEAPKVFRQAFVLLTQRGQQATAEQIAKVQRIRDTWVSFFNEETGRRGWLVTDLQNSPGTTPARILFPYFQGDRKRFTGIALANWGFTPADVLFRAFDNSGNTLAAPASVINPRMITIPPGRQIAMFAEQIHNLSSSDARNGWIEAQSTSSQVTGFFLDADADLTLLDGAVAGNQTATELYFTQASLGSPVFLGNPLRNLISVINPNETSASVQFQLMNDLGQVQETAARTLNPRGRVAENLSTLFPGITQPLRTGFIKATSNSGILGYQSLDSGNAVYALPAQRPSSASRLYSAQFASGGAGGVHYFTDLNFVNTGPASRTLQVLLVDNGGSPVTGITNPATLQLAPGAQIRSRGEDVFGLPDAALASTLTEGSLVVTADGPGVIGDVTFGDPFDGRFLASLPLDGTPVSNFVFSQVAEGNPGGGKPYFTGIAMYNPNDADVSVTIDVFSEDGVKTGTATLPLPRGNRISRTLPQLVPVVTSQVRGYIRIHASGGPIVSFELFGDQVLEFLAAVPPQPITP